MSLTVGSIVIRVTDLDAQLAFWTAALDYVPRQLIADDFALLGPRTGAGVGLSLDVVASPRMLPPRIHLDLYTPPKPPRWPDSRRSAPDACTGASGRPTPTT